MTGLDISKVIKATEKGAGEGLFLAAEHLLGVSNESVPNRDGDLERSGTVKQEGLQSGVGYDTPYAVDQHENLTYRHKDGRKAKYLESAMASEKDVLLQLVNDAIKKELGLS